MSRSSDRCEEKQNIAFISLKRRSFQMIGTNIRGEMSVQKADTVELSIIEKLARTMNISSNEVTELPNGLPWLRIDLISCFGS